MAYRYAFIEDEPLEPFDDGGIVKDIIQRRFHKSVNALLAVDLGPALQGPMTDEQIENLALEVKEEING